MVMILGPPVGSCEYGNRNLVPNIRKLTLTGDTLDKPGQVDERTEASLLGLSYGPLD